MHRICSFVPPPVPLAATQLGSIEQSIRDLSRRRLILANPNPRSRAEMARCLRGIGMDVRETDNLPETLAQLQNQPAELLTLDIDLPGGDLAKTIRALSSKRPPATATFNPAVDIAPTRILLTCSPRTPRERLLPVITPAISAVLLAPCRPELMIDRLARALAQGHAPATATNEHPNVSTIPDLNSVLEHLVFCPYHDSPVPSRRFALRVGKIEVVPDFFDIPTYTKPLPSADHVDYHRLAVTVCPNCLFASIDPANFIVPGSKSDAAAAAKVTPAARYAIVSRVHQRRQSIGELDPAFFSHQRSLTDAVRSYELALQCSTALASQSHLPASNDLLRRGNCHLRIAHVQKTLDSPHDERDNHISHASRLLREAFSSIPESALPRNVYQVVATSIYHGDDRLAHQYLSTLATFRKSAPNPTLREQLDHYFTKSSLAWENRENHRKQSPTTPTPTAPIPFLTQAA